MGLVLLVAAIAPVALLLHFVYIRDKYEREPMGRVLLVYFVSFLTVIPAAVFEQLFDVSGQWGLLGVFLSSFFIIAFSEELVKYLALRWLAVPHPSFNEVYDGIIYGVAASLGFATVENLAYVFLSGGDGLSVAILRAVLSVPGHALWGVMMGYYVGLAKFEHDRRRKLNLVWLGILAAILWHGLYDFFAFGVDVVGPALDGWFTLGLLLVVVVNWVIAIRLIRLAQQRSIFKRPSPLANPLRAYHAGLRFCHRCGFGQPRRNGYCTSCGYRFPER